ncbi:hypothetical protein SAMN05421781_2119 [Marinococcus luteus]|jgi:hypothetical protein|uniref:Uncharacterized protein n=1 Tax=Marinococcus luteus TaxID=1122204 RepID=A0A1H2VJD3_9BACI|nr:hypothetical protein SAMN05421781_2119 [Marinococcus luteus]
MHQGAFSPALEKKVSGYVPRWWTIELIFDVEV